MSKNNSNTNEVSEILQKAVMSSEDIDGCLRFLQTSDASINYLIQSTLEINDTTNKMLRHLLTINK